MLNQLAIKETPWLALQPGQKNQTKPKKREKERKKEKKWKSHQKTVL